MSDVIDKVYHKAVARELDLPVDDEDGEVVLFFQGETWYPVWIKESTTLEQHITLNPTTTAVSNMDGVVTWSRDPNKPVGYNLLKEGTMYQ